MTKDKNIEIILKQVGNLTNAFNDLNNKITHLEKAVYLITEALEEQADFNLAVANHIERNS